MKVHTVRVQLRDSCLLELETVLGAQLRPLHQDPFLNCAVLFYCTLILIVQHNGSIFVRTAVDT